MPMTNNYTLCPKCGGRKPKLMACLDCGYSYLQNRESVVSKICPRCGAKASQEHIHRQACTPSSNATSKDEDKNNLPAWEKLRPSDDIFDRGMVVSGGGVGVGKGKKK